MVSEENIAFLQEQGRRYILAQLPQFETAGGGF